jgi:hypothetical protein
LFNTTPKGVGAWLHWVGMLFVMDRVAVASGLCFFEYDPLEKGTPTDRS